MTDEIRPRLDDYSAQEMVIPEWKLVQRVGGDWAKGRGAIPGQFHNTISDDISDELNIVVVDVVGGRARWGEEIGTAGPLCYSHDARTMQSASGDDCHKCAYRLDAPWSVPAAKRRTMCCSVYTILGIDIDHDNLPVIMRAHGVSVRPVRELITQLRLGKTLKRQYYRASVNVTSKEQKTDYGTVFVLCPRVTRLITDESQVQALRLQSQELLGVPVALLGGEDSPSLGALRESKQLGEKVKVDIQSADIPDIGFWDNV